MARIAIAGFMHETNTFAPVLTTYEHFEQAEGFPGLTQGAEMLSVFPPANIATGGFIKQAQALGHDIAPVLWCAAVPAGYVTEDAYERIVGMIIDGLVTEVEKGAEAASLDPHGAMVAQHQQDGEGELLRRLRERIGDEMPVVVSLDLHVNITELMVALADALIGFRTYPHIDMAETGKRSADHMHNDVNAAHERNHLVGKLRASLSSVQVSRYELHTHWQILRLAARRCQDIGTLP